MVRYVAIDDCGPAINPKVIDGQVHGGIVHAIGQALFERIHYTEDGQLVTSNFADYALPSAADVPSFELDRTETPSPVNSLGVKGIGEAGTIAASPAITNAVIDALRPLGVTYMNMPLGPMRVEANGRWSVEGGEIVTSEVETKASSEDAWTNLMAGVGAQFIDLFGGAQDRASVEVLKLGRDELVLRPRGVEDPPVIACTR